MQTEILYQPAYSLARVQLDAGETMRAESGAMVSMSGGVRIETQATGGFMKSLSRSILGGESFFQNTFHADSAGEVTLAPKLPGDIMVFEMQGGEALVQSGSYLGSATTIDIDAKWAAPKHSLPVKVCSCSSALARVISSSAATALFTGFQFRPGRAMS